MLGAGPDSPAGRRVPEPRGGNVFWRPITISVTGAGERRSSEALRTRSAQPLASAHGRFRGPAARALRVEGTAPKSQRGSIAGESERGCGPDERVPHRLRIRCGISGALTELAQLARLVALIAAVIGARAARSDGWP